MIELTNASNTGATQIATAEFRQITNPSAAALTEIQAVGAAHGRPLALVGERGPGQVALDGDALPCHHRAGGHAELAHDVGRSARQHEASSGTWCLNGSELLHDTIERMLQRELNHRGFVPENGGYSAKLIGWVEVGGQKGRR